jgi:hypothetical protein
MNVRAAQRVGFWSSVLATLMVASFAVSLIVGLVSPYMLPMP